MGWFGTIKRRVFGGTPTYDGAGLGRRTLAWTVANPGAVAALAYTQEQLRAKSRDLVRRNAWAAAGIEAFVANAIGTGIKPQSMVADASLREAIQRLWWDWCEEADATGLTDFYGLQSLACRAMLEGGEAIVRLRWRRPEDGLPVALQVQVLEAEHLPLAMNRELANGNVIRAGIEFDRLGRRVAYHLYRSHPNDGSLGPMSGSGGVDAVRVPAEDVIHQLCRPIWRAWMDQAVLEGSLTLPGYSRRRREYQAAKWIPQGWQWVDPQKEFNAMKLAIRAGLTSRSEAISAYGYDAEDVDREIATDNARADALGLVFDSDPRHDQAPAVAPPPQTEQPTE